MLGQLEVVVAERNPELDWIVVWAILMQVDAGPYLKYNFY